MSKKKVALWIISFICVAVWVNMLANGMMTGHGVIYIMGTMTVPAISISFLVREYVRKDDNKED